MAKKQVTQEEITQAVTAYREKPRARSFLLHKGEEFPDPIPVAPSVNQSRPPSMEDRIRNLLRSEQLAREARAAGMETEAEANDFDVGDEDQYMPGSPHEQEIDGVPVEDLLLEAHAHFQEEQPNPRQGRPEGAAERSESLDGPRTRKQSKKASRGAEEAADDLETPSPELVALLSRLGYTKDAQ